MGLLALGAVVADGRWPHGGPVVRRSVVSPVLVEETIRRFGYAPAALRDHIEGRLIARGFRCPLCGRALAAGFHIDHKTPIATAHTVEELVRLFALDNLDVLCPTCNLRKQAKAVAY